MPEGRHFAKSRFSRSGQPDGAAAQGGEAPLTRRMSAPRTVLTPQDAPRPVAQPAPGDELDDDGTGGFTASLENMDMETLEPYMPTPDNPYGGRDAEAEAEILSYDPWIDDDEGRGAQALPTGAIVGDTEASLSYAPIQPTDERIRTESVDATVVAPHPGPAVSRVPRQNPEAPQGVSGTPRYDAVGQTVARPVYRRREPTSQDPGALNRAVQARRRLDAEYVPSGQTTVSEPERERPLSKGPLPAAKLRFWRWFRAIPIVLMLIMAILCAVTAFLPQQLLRTFLYPVQYASTINAAANRYGVDPNLVAAIIKTESNWRSSSVSVAGAEGLMQLMPSTAETLASAGQVNATRYNPDALLDPVVNIEYGTAFLDYLLDSTGSLDQAIASYNAGPAIVSEWASRLGVGDFANAIVYPETRAYLERVLNAYDHYRELYPNGLVNTGESE